MTLLVLGCLSCISAAMAVWTFFVLYHAVILTVFGIVLAVPYGAGFAALRFVRKRLSSCGWLTKDAIAGMDGRRRIMATAVGTCLTALTVFCGVMAAVGLVIMVIGMVT